MGVPLGERNDPASCTLFSEVYIPSWHFQIFNYRDTRYCAASRSQKHNKSLARSPTYGVHARASMVAVRAYKSATILYMYVHTLILISYHLTYAHRYPPHRTGMSGSILKCRAYVRSVKKSCHNTRPEFKSNISMKILERKKLRFELNGEVV